MSVAILVCTSCSVATAPPPEGAAVTADIAQLWIEPEDVTRRDLLWGPGGAAGAPVPGETFRIIDVDEAGHSRGYDVVARDGRKWKIKLGDEAQSEIVASRLLWAIGFHQPAMYALDSWKLEGVARTRHTVARFRLKDGYKARGSWSWQANPFAETREFKGLLVAQLLLNNWDLKSSNNRIYLVEEGGQPRRWFVVQDLGAALGATRWPIGSRNSVGDFERQRLIKGLGADRILFDYAGRRRDLFRELAPSDVVWTCRRLAQLTDQQWRDAFRAAYYSDATSARFIAKLRSKIQEGLAMIPQSGNDF